MKTDFSYNAFENDISVATFYFPRHTATELVKAPKMSMLDFLSQVTNFASVITEPRVTDCKSKKPGHVKS